MIVGINKLTSYIIKFIQEINTKDEWLKYDILKAIETQNSFGFKVWWVVAGNDYDNCVRKVKNIELLWSW